MMQLNFNIESVRNYHSASQVARILTENWVTDNMFCPRCGNSHIKHFENNHPVADFFCPICKNEYELKSKNGKLGNKDKQKIKYVTFVMAIQTDKYCRDVLPGNG